jgi:hypothetical protein
MTRAVRRSLSVLVSIGALTFTSLIPEPSGAYETYHDPTPGVHTGRCVDCHPAWRNWGPLHHLHVGGAAFTSNCYLCHMASDDSENPFIMWRVGDGSPGSSFGCTGCHGRDYGETIRANYTNGGTTFMLAGLPKMSGYGLIKQHLAKGVTRCLSCHDDVPRCFIRPESTAPPNYSRLDVNVQSPCSSSEEDGPGEQPPGGEDGVGLDNDGDGRKDEIDPDCSPPPVLTPGESGAPCGAAALTVTGVGATGEITIDYDGPCGASDNSLYFGPLTHADISSYNYTGRICSIGSGGTFTFDPGAGSFFLLVVGRGGTFEGPYGEAFFQTDPNNPSRLFFTERPPEGTGACLRTYDPNHRCD